LQILVPSSRLVKPQRSLRSRIQNDQINDFSWKPLKGRGFACLRDGPESYLFWWDRPKKAHILRDATVVANPGLPVQKEASTDKLPQQDDAAEGPLDREVRSAEHGPRWHELVLIVVAAPAALVASVYVLGLWVGWW
jgi:hypothetical protein